MSSLTVIDSPIRLAACLALFTALSAVTTRPASAENHALILTIDYRGTDQPLPGIESDAKRARDMAAAMNVPDSNIVHIRNRQLTLRGIRHEISALQGRIHTGDNVFLYFSGHGKQVFSLTAGSRCTEGLLAADLRLYSDGSLHAGLDDLGKKAGQVIMFNDSCFSGGATTKSIKPGVAMNAHLGITTMVAKHYPGPIFPRSPDTVAPETGCGSAINKGLMESPATAFASGNVLYLAAAADNEVAYATNIGSIATLAWATCVNQHRNSRPSGDLLNGLSLQACAQAELARYQVRQTITLVGDAHRPINLAPRIGPKQASASGIRALEAFRRGADPGHHVALTPTQPILRIGHDSFEFSVTSDRAGYLYVLMARADGQGPQQIFPNERDRNNAITPGTYHFPRGGWTLRSKGPAGERHVIAIVSRSPQTVEHDEMNGPLPRTYTASEIVTVREID